jgi:hypothetical protein
VEPLEVDIGFTGEYVESKRIPPKRGVGASDWRMDCDIGMAKRPDVRDEGLESAAAAAVVVVVVVERRRVVNCVVRRVKEDATALAMMDLI